MSTKIKKEDLKNISGGESSVEVIFTCESPTCGKTFSGSKAKVKNGTIYCPYCGAPYGQFSD